MLLKMKHLWPFPLGLSAHNLNERIALARSKPGSLTYATSGVGTMLHLAMEICRSAPRSSWFMWPITGWQITSDAPGD